MGTGYLSVAVYTAKGALPVEGACVRVTDPVSRAEWEAVTNEWGETGLLALEAPDASQSLDPGNMGPVFAAYNIEAEKPDFIPVLTERVRVYDTVTTTLSVSIAPAIGGEEKNVVEIPPPAIESGEPRAQKGPDARGEETGEPVIPYYITVHLGRHDQQARNVRIPFIDYIKNVASSEIYPTWPQAALEANILTVTTFALNRVLTNWYHGQGYEFDITSCPDTDQAFTEGREIYLSISQITDKIFNSYLGRPGLPGPIFALFCNGTTDTCTGLNQWGTVSLAQKGNTTLEILRSYYPEDVEIITCDKLQSIPEVYPGTPLYAGARGDAVLTVQQYLNTISPHYPEITQLESVGIFGPATQRAVMAFQSLFGLKPSGVIDPITWNALINAANTL